MTVIEAADSGKQQSIVDAKYMAHALNLAKHGRYDSQPNPHVGCVIVKDQQIVGEGFTSPAGGPHAEINALNTVGEVRGATVYVSLEPCCHTGRTGPCTEALINAAPTRVVVATLDANPLVAGNGIKALKQAGIEVQVGVGEAEALQMNRAFFHRMRTNRPFVQLKIAMSLDGHTAMANGESQWITSQQAREDVHRLRLEAGAVLTGIDTVLADDPKMTARIDEVKRQPLRVVLDTQGRMPSSAKMLNEVGRTLIMQAQGPATGNQNRAATSVEVFEAPLCENNKIDLFAALTELAKREINQLLVEAGATLSGAFIQQGLVDEIIVYMAPDILGSDARNAFKTTGLLAMADKLSFEIKDTRMIGRDLKLTLA